MEAQWLGIAGMKLLGADFPKAQASALNKTMAQVRTQAIRSITSRYNVKRADVVAKMGEPRKATPQRLIASFTAGGRRISFAYFGAKQYAGGVRVKTMKAGAEQKVPHMFIATVTGRGGVSTHTGAFLKVGPKRANKYGKYIGQKRQRMVEWTGPSVPQMLSGVMQSLEQLATEKLPELLAHEIKWRSGRGQ